MNKKILYFICGLSLSMTIFMVIDSYGLFESKNVLNVDSNIAKWNVFINGTDIKKNKTFVVDKMNYRHYFTAFAISHNFSVARLCSSRIDSRFTALSLPMFASKAI